MEQNKLYRSEIHFDWYEAAEYIVDRGWDQELMAEDYGYRLANQIVDGFLDIKILRESLTWLSALDKEAYQLIDGDEINYHDQIELYARRTAHHAGRNALDLTKSETRCMKYLSIRQSLANKGKIEKRNLYETESIIY